ncbi:MAG: hypothetical protein WC747_01565 [Candidatus Babeliales bacterium]|jgi:hypothetical protein
MNWSVYWEKKQHVSRKLCSNLQSIDSFELYKNKQGRFFRVEPLGIMAEPVSGALKITYRKRMNSSYSIVTKVAAWFRACFADLLKKGIMS